MLASEGKRAVASDECCQLFWTLHLLFAKIPWTAGSINEILAIVEFPHWQTGTQKRRGPFGAVIEIRDRSQAECHGLAISVLHQNFAKAVCLLPKQRVDIVPT